MEATSAKVASLFTRRRVLGWGGAGAVGAVAGCLTWPRSEGGLGPMTPAADVVPATDQPAEGVRSDIPAPSGVVGRDDFLPHLKTSFVLDSGLSCTLTEVSAARKLAGPGAGFTSFSLLFMASAGTSCDSRIHRVTHGKMGELELFLSPIGHAGEATRLEAVFSQRV